MLSDCGRLNGFGKTPSMHNKIKQEPNWAVFNHMSYTATTKCTIKCSPDIWASTSWRKKNLISMWECNFVRAFLWMQHNELILRRNTSVRDIPIHTFFNLHNYLWMFSASINTLVMKFAPSHQQLLWLFTCNCPAILSHTISCLVWLFPSRKKKKKRMSTNTCTSCIRSTLVVSKRLFGAN